MHRSSSYAAIVAGNSQASATPRGGLFAQLGHSTQSPGPHYSHHRSQSRSFDANGFHDTMQPSSTNPSWGRPPQPTPSTRPPSLTAEKAFVPDADMVPFFVPSYLQGSRFAERVEETHNRRVQALRESRAASGIGPASPSRSSSSATLDHVAAYNAAATHRGVARDVIERSPPPAVDEPVPSWPTRWSDTDKNPQLDLSPDGRIARFATPHKSHDEAAAVRADHPMPRQCGIYYYEVTILSKGKDGIFGIGFSTSKVALTRIPGWEPDSWAYHGDDGHIFTGSSQGKPFGPKYGSADVIGCGINFRTASAFFTKNGQLVDGRVRDLPRSKTYYPIIGAKRPNEMLKANFGQEPFAFDIDKMVKDETAEIQREIASTSNAPPEEGTQAAYGLIRQYLQHEGYLATARALFDEVQEQQALGDGESSAPRESPPEADENTLNRQIIRAAILEGDIDKALKKTKAYYPSVLKDNPDIYFRLRCRKFIELIARTNNLRHQLAKRSGATGPAPTEGGDAMDVDFNPTMSSEDDGADRMDTSEDDLQARFLRQQEEMFEYGREITEEFKNDQRRKVQKALSDCYTLAADKDAGAGHLGPLLREEARGPVAEALNGAILGESHFLFHFLFPFGSPGEGSGPKWTA